MRVKEIMTTSVKTASATSSVREIAVLMCFNKISGVPIVDNEKNIIGVISEKDVLHAMYPGVDDVMQNGSYDFEALEAEYNDILSSEVGDHMSKNVFTVHPEDPVMKAASIMFLHKIRRIPVADQGILVGIISLGDVHKAIFQENLDGITRATDVA